MEDITLLMNHKQEACLVGGKQGKERESKGECLVLRLGNKEDHSENKS
jgi:hypothetical protein